MFWGPSLFLSPENWITWMSVCHIHMYTYICLTPGRIHGSPHEGSNWDIIEYEYLEQRQLHIKVGLEYCKHQHVNQTASRAKHSEDFTLPSNPNNSWPTMSQGFWQVYIYDADWNSSYSVPWCWEERWLLTHWSGLLAIQPCDVAASPRG